MADLPQEGCTREALFTYCGVDILRVLMELSSTVLRFSSHIVHIEVTNCLDANFFILTLHRFMGRRGAVCSILSDNGRNFVGSRNEL